MHGISFRSCRCGSPELHRKQKTEDLRVVKYFVYRAIQIVSASGFTHGKRSPRRSLCLPARPFDRTHNPIARGRVERHERAIVPLQRKAVFVLSAVRIRPERRYSNPVFDFQRLRVPEVGRAIGFRRCPSFNMPTIVRHVFWHAPQLYGLAHNAVVFVAVDPASADPCEPQASPHDPIVGFAVRVRPTGSPQAVLHRRRCLVRFSRHSDHGEVVCTMNRRRISLALLVGGNGCTLLVNIRS